MFGKQKYNRGSCKGRGMWNHVEKGSRILTDGWAAYTHLNKLGYPWDWVNHREDDSTATKNLTDHYKILNALCI